MQENQKFYFENGRDISETEMPSFEYFECFGRLGSRKKHNGSRCFGSRKRIMTADTLAQ